MRVVRLRHAAEAGSERTEELAAQTMKMFINQRLSITSEQQISPVTSSDDQFSGLQYNLVHTGLKEHSGLGGYSTPK